jgi:hypothetical protein
MIGILLCLTGKQNSYSTNTLEDAFLKDVLLIFEITDSETIYHLKKENMPIF